MNKEELQLLSQLIETMNDSFVKLEESFNKKEVKDFKKNKQEILDLQKKIQEIVK